MHKWFGFTVANRERFELCLFLILSRNMKLNYKNAEVLPSLSLFLDTNLFPSYSLLLLAKLSLTTLNKAGGLQKT